MCIRDRFGVQCGRNSNKLDKLYKTPPTLWTSAMSRFTNMRAENVRCITFQWLQWIIFQGIWEENQSQLINRSTTYFGSKSKEIAKSLFKTIIFCGRNNIALRGPRDDDPQNASLSGNFQALLEFRIDSGEQTLQHHLKTAPRNATYIYKTIQNEMITTAVSYTHLTLPTSDLV